MLVQNHCDVKSSIKSNDGLVKEANKLSGRIQDEVNSLIKSFIGGNTNPGIGTKHLVNDVYYLRGRNGARVFYRMINGTMEIPGKAYKGNEQTVINLVIKLFGG